MRTILTHIHENPTHNLLIHCSLGKDRTGIMIAIILALAGAEHSAIGCDYGESEVGLHAMRMHLTHIIHRQRPNMMAEDASSYVDRVTSAQPVVIRLMLQRVCTAFGNVDKFVVDACGLSNSTVDTIRSILVQTR